MQLFDVLSKQESYDEKALLKKLKHIKKEQLANLKSHLYKQLLASLRRYHKQHQHVVQIREMLDYADVLYSKGLHHQSLHLLQKAKQKCISRKETILQLEINHFERLIESRYITRSLRPRAKALVNESKVLTSALQKSDAYSNYALALYSRFIRKGHIKNETEFLRFKRYFKQQLPVYKDKELDFSGKIYRYQCFVWYAYIVQDFLLCYKYALHWVKLFDENPEMKNYSPELYLKGLHNLLAAIYYLGRVDRFRAVFKVMEDFCSQDLGDFMENLKLYSFIYLENNRINLFFMEGKFKEGALLIPNIQQQLEDNAFRLDTHRQMVLYYKFACLHIGSAQPKEAIRHLRPIIENQHKALREDIQCFARILNLVAHYELGNDDLLEYQIKSVYRYLLKMDELGTVQKEIISFLKKAITLHKNELKKALIDLRLKLLSYEQHPYEKRPFLYLDIISWLESHVEGTDVQEVIRRKYLKKLEEKS